LVGSISQVGQVRIPKMFSFWSGFHSFMKERERERESNNRMGTLVGTLTTAPN